MRTKEDWNMQEWRDYYDRLQQKAYMTYQQTGDPKHDREQFRYSKIVDAFNGYLSYAEEADTERLRRWRNIDAYIERNVLEETYTKAEVKRMLETLKQF